MAAAEAPFSKAPVEVVLGLGSNQGDRRAILEGAVAALGEVLLPQPAPRRAALRETAPMHVLDQPAFLNTAVAGWYAGTPEELLEQIHRIEAVFGRDRSRERRWGERSLDIDILLFGGLVVADPPGLEIPHPRLRERGFALEPLVELCPGAVEPVTGVLYREYLARTRRGGAAPTTPAGRPGASQTHPWNGVPRKFFEPEKKT